MGDTFADLDTMLSRVDTDIGDTRFVLGNTRAELPWWRHPLRLADAATRETAMTNGGRGVKTTRRWVTMLTDSASRLGRCSGTLAWCSSSTCHGVPGAGGEIAVVIKMVQAGPRSRAGASVSSQDETLASRRWQHRAKDAES